MIIGLTGGSGTGKSSACDFFEKKGFLIVDMDVISREVCRKGQKCLDEIVHGFGSKILNQNGELNRRMLADEVFNDEKKLKLLNEITHKYIIEETKKIIEQNPARNIVLDAPLLFEAGMDSYCTVTVAVLSSMQNRIRRLIKRDCLDEKRILARLASQPTDDFYIKNCDFAVYNDFGIDDLYKSLEKELDFLNEE